MSFFFIDFKSGTVNKSREFKFSNPFKYKHSTRNWYKMNWFSVREREREISLSTVWHRPHFDSWDQYNQEIQNMMDNIKEIQPPAQHRRRNSSSTKVVPIKSNIHITVIQSTERGSGLRVHYLHPCFSTKYLIYLITQIISSLKFPSFFAYAIVMKKKFQVFLHM